MAHIGGSIWENGKQHGSYYVILGLLSYIGVIGCISGCHCLFLRTSTSIASQSAIVFQSEVKISFS